jgi:hypothetical protein
LIDVNRSEEKIRKRFLPPMSRPPLSLSKKSSQQFKRRNIEEPEIAAESAEVCVFLALSSLPPLISCPLIQQETASVQVSLGDEASHVEAFQAASALYKAWVEGLVECIYAGYNFGSTRAEVTGVVAGLQARITEILCFNKERLALLQVLWDVCVESDDSLAHVLSEEQRES